MLLMTYGSEVWALKKKKRDKNTSCCNENVKVDVRFDLSRLELGINISEGI